MRSLQEQGKEEPCTGLRLEPQFEVTADAQVLTTASTRGNNHLYPYRCGATAGRLTFVAGIRQRQCGLGYMDRGGYYRTRISTADET